MIRMKRKWKDDNKKRAIYNINYLKFVIRIWKNN